jgi:hypothetical protein
MSKFRTITTRLTVPALIAGSVLTLGAPVKWSRMITAVIDLFS